MNTETLTNDMIRALRTEAVTVGDQDMVRECDFALAAPSTRAVSRWHCAEAINRARAQGDDPDFVRVVP